MLGLRWSGVVLPPVFPWCHVAGLASPFGDSVTTVKSSLCEKSCPPWGLGKDYTQQWRYMNVAPDAYLLVAV